MTYSIKNHLRYALRYKISHFYRESSPDGELTLYRELTPDGESSPIPEAERSGDLGISLALISK